MLARQVNIGDDIDGALVADFANRANPLVQQLASRSRGAQRHLSGTRDLKIQAAKP
jgi:hypothetical protein